MIALTSLRNRYSTEAWLVIDPSLNIVVQKVSKVDVQIFCTTYDIHSMRNRFNNVVQTAKNKLDTNDGTDDLYLFLLNKDLDINKAIEYLATLNY